MKRLALFLVPAMLFICLGCEEEENLPPTCQIAAPGNREYFLPGSTVTIRVDASDEQDKIDKVVLDINGTQVSTLTQAPYEYHWNTEGLAPGDYTIRADVTDDGGLTAFSMVTIHVNWEDKTTDTFIDSRDGKEYRMIRLNEQWWMAENLNYTTTEGSWAYNNDPALAEIHGLLYNWETACEVCPDGWHLPSKTEWESLQDYVRGKYSLYDDYIFSQGPHLASTTGWEASNNEGAVGNNPQTNDSSGFGALPSGMHIINGNGLDTSLHMGKKAAMWCTNHNYDGYENHALNVGLWYTYSIVLYESEDILNGCSVRCIKDE